MILIAALQATLVQLFVLIGPGLLFSLLMNLIAGGVERKAFSLLGRRGYLWLFGWLGTAVHETGHALMCLVFRHKINRIELFNFNPDSHTLGQVEHSYNPRNIYHIVGQFFIGIGPIILGTALIYLSAYFLLTNNVTEYFQNLEIQYETISSFSALQELITDVVSTFKDFLSDTFSGSNLSRWQLYAFCYLLFSIGSAMKLSKSDLDSALKGFLVIVFIIFLANLVLDLIEYEGFSDVIMYLNGYLSVFYTAMIFALVLNIILLALLVVLEGIKGLFK